VSFTRREGFILSLSLELVSKGSIYVLVLHSEFCILFEFKPRVLIVMVFSICTGGKRPYGPGSSGPLVLVVESGSITRDQCRSRFQHEPGPIGHHVDALQREGAWVSGPDS
jgi:hypothetical protein